LIYEILCYSHIKGDSSGMSVRPLFPLEITKVMSGNCVRQVSRSEVEEIKSKKNRQPLNELNDGNREWRYSQKHKV
jgi:hypothetical protein